jgi:hypothetical protein
MLTIPVLGRLRQADCEASLSYTVRLCLKKKKNKEKKKKKEHLS